MPRTARIDIPGILYHVLFRGIERRDLFPDNRDREFFLGRLSTLLLETQTDLLAYALLTNHGHLLVRPRREKLEVLMRRLLTAHAVRFNRRHRRTGYLFQNRFQSIPCHEETYLLTLVKYVHLNPLKARMVQTLEELDRYPWTGHPAMMGSLPLPGHDVRTVLSLFGGTLPAARKAYREFLSQETSRESEGGNLPIEGKGELSTLALPDDLRAMQTCGVMGNEEFLAHLQREKDLWRARAGNRPPLEEVLGKVAAANSLSLNNLAAKSTWSSSLVRARVAATQEAVFHFGYSSAEVARALGLDRATISRYLRKSPRLPAPF